jgi:hypothetical protein
MYEELNNFVIEIRDSSYDKRTITLIIVRKP